MTISQAGVPVQQPVFWAMPSGSNPAGAVTVSYAGAAGTQVQTQAAQVQVCTCRLCLLHARCDFKY